MINADNQILFGNSDHDSELVAEIGAYLHFGIFVTASDTFVAYSARLIRIKTQKSMNISHLQKKSEILYYILIAPKIR